MADSLLGKPLYRAPDLLERHASFDSRITEVLDSAAGLMFLPKPFTLLALVAKVRGVLDTAEEPSDTLTH